MAPAIRPATPRDLSGIVALLTQDARDRNALDPLLWRLAPDVSTRIERAVGGALNASRAPAQELWFVAEQAGQVVGATHAMLVPVPPIYNAAADSPGLLLDDCFVSAEAPAGTAEALLVATEAALKAAGASVLVTSCLASGHLRPLYERHGYEPVTLYTVKHGFSIETPAPRVRPATVGDVPGIVARSAQHRRMLARINPRFWHIHPEADRRFDAWMRRSLTFGDRDVFVSVEAGEVRGYVIAQPVAHLLVPAAHEIARIGVIDDFYDDDLADTAALSNGRSNAESLLAAAESAFARRGFDSALVVCPAAWLSKVALLEQRGYRSAKLWMVKHWREVV
jgi:predicted N-acetyltransferase YhbS